MLQASCALNVAGYLLLKSELANKERTLEDPMLNINPDSEIKSHPVIRRLQQLNKLNIKLEENIESKVPSLSSELDSLLRAASLMKEKVSDEDSDSNEEFQDENSEILEKSMITNLESKSLVDSISPLLEKREDKEVTLKRNHELLNDARFGLRQKELLLKAPAKPSSFVASDFGDDDADITSAANASKSLASTINSIQQRSTTKSRKSAHRSEDIDNQGENEVLERGLAMMEADIGLSDEENDEGKDNIMEDDDFYSRVKKRRENEIERKKQLYSVAPKYPVVEEEIDGERAISKTILKNRGLVPHKAKINRNPRVKKREQYRKALIRRKGAVREVRTNEAHNYGGEATGVKATISRSRKLSSR
jgi:U3 small nucleolar RNA-associated protein 3